MVFGDIVTILIALALVGLLAWLLPRFRRRRGKPNFRSGVSYEKPQQEGGAVDPAARPAPEAPRR